MKRSLAFVLGVALLAPMFLVGCGDEGSKPAAAPAGGAAGGAQPGGAGAGGAGGTDTAK